MSTALITFFVALSAVLALVAAGVWAANRKLRRAQFIRTYEWPRGLLTKFERKSAGVGFKDAALVSRGLRQFFMAYLMSGQKYVAMPSQAADDLWHEFILYTRDYEQFCKGAFGGLLHHTHAVGLRDGQKRDNEGLRRVWWFACKDENISPHKPSRMPLLFALDSKLKIANGYVYHTDCASLRRSGASGTQCTGDFASTSIDGGTAGFGDFGGDGGSGADSSGGGDSGSSCGGGSCGGGGD